MVMGGRLKRVGGLLSAIIVAISAPALAHHSFAVFDHTRTVTVVGTVAKFQWTNPHAFLEVEIPDDKGSAKGSVRQYTIELTSINMLTRAGWRSNMIKAGDRVKAVVAPLLTGEPGGLLLDVTLSDGRKLESPVPAANTFKRTPEGQCIGCPQ